MKRRGAWALFGLFLFLGTAGILAQPSNPSNAVLAQFLADVKSRGFQYATQQLAYTVGQGAASLVFPSGIVVSGQTYSAPACTSNGCPGSGTACTWDATHDVGPCINSAISAASSAGGGTVNIPAGQYGIATQIAIHTSGVHLAGAGVGNARDSAAPTVFIAITELTWIGAAGGTEFVISPAGGQSLYSVDVTGIVFDCASLANICASITQVSNSTINIGGSEARLNNIILTTEPTGFSDAPGNQGNDIWLSSRSTSATYSPTGILFDQGVGGTFNTSLNRIHSLYAWFAKGDGIVIASSDNNLYEMIQTGQDPTNKGGTPIVWANSAYVMKNGLPVNGVAYSQRVLKAESSGIVLGYTTGSTVTTGVHVGSAALNTISLTTSGTTANNGFLLNFSGGTTGVTFGMVANAPGGWSSGIPPDTQVTAFTGTTINLNMQSPGGVAASLPVTFSYGINASAVPGTYTMTAVDATHWNLTAPAGGNSQTNIALANGAVSFTDMVIPLTGTPTAGDTFVIVVPSPAHDITMESLDKANSLPNPMVEPGANIWLATTSNPQLIPQGGTGDIVNQPIGGSNNGVDFGGISGGTRPGDGGVRLGGLGNNCGGFGAGCVAGHNLFATGTYSTAHNDSNVPLGQSSDAGGQFANDRARFGIRCWGAGTFTGVTGTAQACDAPLMGTGSSTTAIPLTSTGAAASPTTCINIPTATGYALIVTMMAFDHVTAGKSFSAVWGGGSVAPHILTRNTTAATTLLDGAATNVAPDATRTNGSVSGIAATLTVDTTNGCVVPTFTPPSGNTDTWNAVAWATTVEAQ